MKGSKLQRVYLELKKERTKNKKYMMKEDFVQDVKSRLVTINEQAKAMREFMRSGDFLLLSPSQASFLDEGYVSLIAYQNNIGAFIDEVESDTFLARLRREDLQLETRLNRLTAFIDSDAFTKLDAKQQDYLRTQLGHMRGYLRTLKLRVLEAKTN